MVIIARCKVRESKPPKLHIIIMLHDYSEEWHSYTRAYQGTGPDDTSLCPSKQSYYPIQDSISDNTCYKYHHTFIGLEGKRKKSSIPESLGPSGVGITLQV